MRLIKWIEEHKDLFGAFQAIVTIVAVVVGGLWTYMLTSQYRETVPKLTIKQDVSGWALQDGSTLLRVDSTLTNAGKVRIEGVNGKMIVWRLLPETKEQATDYKAGNIFFRCKDDQGVVFPNCVPEQGLNLPDTSKQQFIIKDLAGNLEPGESLPYWRYVHFDGDAKTIEVYTVINKPGTSQDEWIFDSTFNLTHPTPASNRRQSHSR